MDALVDELDEFSSRHRSGIALLLSSSKIAEKDSKNHELREIVDALSAAIERAGHAGRRFWVYLG